MIPAVQSAYVAYLLRKSRGFDISVGASKIGMLNNSAKFVSVSVGEATAEWIVLTMFLKAEDELLQILYC